MGQDVSKELRLGFLVHDVSRMRRSMVDRALKPMGLTRSQWWVLAFLSRQDGMPQGVLADQLDIGKVAVGALIDRLEAHGLVERQHDPGDRRVKRIYLTRAGDKLIHDIRTNIAEVERSIIEGIGDTDIDAAVRVLRSMKSNLLVLLSISKADQDDGAGILETPIE